MVGQAPRARSGEWPGPSFGSCPTAGYGGLLLKVAGSHGGAGEKFTAALHAEAGLKPLSHGGLLDPARVLAGLPHPSGECRTDRLFPGRKERAALLAKTNPDRIDAVRERLQRRVAGLKV